MSRLPTNFFVFVLELEVEGHLGDGLSTVFQRGLSWGEGLLGGGVDSTGCAERHFFIEFSFFGLFLVLELDEFHGFLRAVEDYICQMSSSLPFFGLVECFIHEIEF